MESSVVNTEELKEVGEEITPQRKNILIELEADFRDEKKKERPTTVVGLKRINFFS